MADCNKTDTFLAEWGRMCNSNLCTSCPMKASCEDVNFILEHGKEVVTKWSDEHPERQKDEKRVCPDDCSGHHGLGVFSCLTCVRNPAFVDRYGKRIDPVTKLHEDMFSVDAE